ncbi:excinuclease ABC subunit UvrA [Roseivirga pacifica]|uniref:excinuclease ABC subunit UvrA n=1 Tax=Roseivirga pacifica TaxID=1267423 RepID=UPI002094C3EF|nr:excinuclease ABC subunit UvrA [Roseivirga pacifica]MCO6358868.1 excinuclease ABC subunit A [Roseivirga pacifica]MCO6365496.1 excinuclease ABC subunit A [Roseivirga pacifica]MCO6371774.1 excinuclease ABC subunit A [Roseivirga pacifica]MCO6376115.1 excinuclease ABC subunit A [Roseivirga pacifica]MCO6379152.1 excinuclease ABC subunit A [Roseivirga pacifica]
MSTTTASTNTPIDELDPREFIIIKGAKVNNLKSLSVAIPRNKLVVVTGLSGSGKSSLAFDTLFAEGQRMYVESLSSYARQFLGRMEKPEVDYIKGVSPAIAIEQKVSTRNPRSTVGTSTEIYDYLKLLFARIGKTYSPVSGEEVKRDSVTSIVDFIMSKEEGARLMILCPLIRKEDRTFEQELNVLLQKGYTRVLVDGSPFFIEDLLEDESKAKEGNIEVLIDRGVVQHDEDTQFRFSDSVQTALFEGEGDCIIDLPDEGRFAFSDRFEADGILFEEPSVNLFTFNNPYGACKRCEGFGKILGIDKDLVIPDKSLSVYDGAIAPWRSETMRKWVQPLLKHGIEFDFPIHRAYNELTKAEQELLWTGNKYFKGLNEFFEHLESKTHKIQYRVLLSRYRGRTDCPECKGTRLRGDASYVKINDSSITDLVLLPIEQVHSFFSELKITAHEEKIAGRLVKEIKNRIDYLSRVGLGYLTLNRLTSTLSGGEYQRIKLSTSLGSALVGSMYILDEPSIGLHPRDTDKLISVLLSLRDLGNTVVVVEHEEKVMRAADQIIDIGPDAGSHGGELVFQGTIDEMLGTDTTYTAKYLNGTEKLEVPAQRRKWNNSIIIKGARENNLKNLDVEIPLGVLSVVTGVSGSGKSTLIKRLLYPALGKTLGTVSEQTGKMDALEGSLKTVTQIEFVDQNPIGKSSRSNPVTYVKAYDAIRQLFTDQGLAKQRGYKPAFFSFNVDGGRCETCQGEGVVKIEMQFMADIQLTCESCKGKRFKQEILEVKYKEKNISDVLEMTIDDAIDFFAEEKSVVNKLIPLQEVGLGYIRLGQSSNSLSGGEAQRVKLAYFLGKGKGTSKDHILFIFDEPTTGLHFHDIAKLMKSINALIEQGNSVVIIEHNTEVIKCADWILDLGPEGGNKGGKLCFAGTPEDMIKLKDNYTAQYLAEVL